MVERLKQRRIVRGGGIARDQHCQPLLLRGWAIPCATDIAFSYLVAKAIFGGGHPAVPFLLLLAIADDALGLIVLALFYPIGDLHLVVGGLLMAAALGVSLALRRRKTLNFWPYILAGGALSWCALFWGGLHPALALVPIVPFLPHAAKAFTTYDRFFCSILASTFPNREYMHAAQSYGKVDNSLPEAGFKNQGFPSGPF